MNRLENIGKLKHDFCMGLKAASGGAHGAGGENGRNPIR
jgi:hypothetical protein